MFRYKDKRNLQAKEGLVEIPISAISCVMCNGQLRFCIANNAKTEYLIVTEKRVISKQEYDSLEQVKMELLSGEKSKFYLGDNVVAIIIPVFRGKMLIRSIIAAEERLAKDVQEDVGIDDVSELIKYY